MSCKYCEKYPVEIVPHYSWRYSDGRTEVICKDTYGPVLIVGTFDPEACEITDMKASEIRYCPWCGRDLCCDEPEPDKEPDDGKAQAETATPGYYTAHGVEAIDVIEAVCNRAQLAPDDVFCLGNVLKYALRAGRKGGTEADFESDCAKAANYACRMVTGRWLDQDGGAHE